MLAYLQGLSLGLAYVAPIGVQNLFVINAGLSQPRAAAYRGSDGGAGLFAGTVCGPHRTDDPLAGGIDLKRGSALRGNAVLL